MLSYYSKQLLMVLLREIDALQILKRSVTYLGWSAAAALQASLLLVQTNGPANSPELLLTGTAV